MATTTSKLYLFAYNVIQFVGWLYSLYAIVSFVATRGTYENLWLSVRHSVSVFQTLQLLEVAHCLLKLVPSNWFQTLIQILSRLMLVWGVLFLVPTARNSVGVPMLLVCWSIAEITRYLYYALNIFDSVPYALSWLRYTLFIVLYPTGVSGELITIVKALPFVRDRQLYSIPLPNFANVSFYYHYMLVVVMLSYIPFFPQLYFYMIRQRKKVLASDNTRNKADIKSR